MLFLILRYIARRYFIHLVSNLVIMKAGTCLIGACLLFTLYGCLKKASPLPDTKPITPVPVFTFTPSVNPVTTPVTGTWQWILTNASEGGLFTPASTHSKMAIQFNTDSTVMEFRNDTLVLHENYTYVKNYQFYDGSISDAVEMNQTFYRPTLKNDTLKLDLIVIADPSYSVFKRVN